MPCPMALAAAAPMSVHQAHDAGYAETAAGLADVAAALTKTYIDSGHAAGYSADQLAILNGPATTTSFGVASPAYVFYVVSNKWSNAFVVYDAVSGWAGISTYDTIVHPPTPRHQPKYTKGATRPRRRPGHPYVGKQC